MAGCAETGTCRQPNDDSETDSDDIEIVRAVLKRGEAAVAAQINVTRFVTDLLNPKHVKTYRQSYRLIVKFIVKSETKIIVFRMTNIRATALHRKAPLRTND